jgi:hypothetical protein
MTPEEAKDLIEIEFDAFDNYCVSNHCSVIDMIYFDFKSRTCESCRYCNVGSICDGSMECLLGISCIQSDTYDLVEKDFGCNKWEQKL